jgi:hypothetical protein
LISAAAWSTVIWPLPRRWRMSAVVLMGSSFRGRGVPNSRLA